MNKVNPELSFCVEAEQKNDKQNNRIRLQGLLTIREYQNFMEEGKLIVGGASVACVMSHRYPISVGGCWFF